MRSFQQIVSFLFALFVCAMAQESYDTTVYITSTVMLVNTVTMSGSPTGAVANQTSTIAALAPTAYPTGSSNVTVAPTASAALPSQAAEFTGAASALNAPAVLAAMAAGLGYLVL
jgi:hypothetical protein